MFHGEKEPFKNKRDRRLSKFGCRLMIPLVSEMLIETSGEVLDAFGDQQDEDIKMIYQIAGRRRPSSSYY